MKTALVNLASPSYYRSQDKLNDSARRFKVDSIVSWTYGDFAKTQFYTQHLDILSQPRGAGYWLWKPYIILQALTELSWNDLLIYCDAGIEITGDISPLKQLCQEKAEIMLFNNCHYLNKAWTKRDCFVLMNCDECRYWDAVQSEGAFQVYKKCEQSLQFVNEWLEFAKNVNILTDIPNVCNLSNFPEFRDHRHDQSILSLLGVKYGLEIFRNPSQKGVAYRKLFPNSPYGVLLNHHRTKTNDLN